jgi:hypothetical protein
MTDSGPPTDLGTIYVVGQRRRPGGLFPSSSGGSGGGSDIPPDEAQETEEDEQAGGGLPLPPCSDPNTARDWNADAAAAKVIKDLKALAAATHPNEANFNSREYGAALWELPDGSIIAGPLRYGAMTFYEAAQAGANGQEARGTVEIDWTAPSTDAVLIGMVHTHGMGSFLPSGYSHDTDDQANLSYVIGFRDYQRPGTGDQAKIYIAANEPGEYENLGPTKIHVYDKSNRDTAISGEKGPEAKSCEEQ